MRGAGGGGARGRRSGRGGPGRRRSRHAEWTSIGRVPLALAAALAVFLAFGPGAAPAADVSARTGLAIDWWDGTKDAKGSQILVPLQVGTRVRDFQMDVLTGYASTSIDMPGLVDEEMSAPLDAKVLSSYVISGKLPVDILIGLDANLPTGKTDLAPEELVLTVDPELFPIVSFGEGFNLNPVLALAKGWGRWTAGLGFGYLWRGEYDPSRTFGITDYDPGDIATVTGDLRYEAAPGWTARLFANASRYGKDELADQPVLREGDLLLLGLGLRRERDRWDAGLTLRGIFRGKREVPDFLGGLTTEGENSNGDEWRADLIVRHALGGRTILSSYVRGLLLTENDYPEGTTFLFAGRREKIEAGFGILRAFTPALEGELLVRGFYLHDEATSFPIPKDEQSYRGIGSAVRITGRF